MTVLLPGRNLLVISCLVGVTVGIGAAPAGAKEPRYVRVTVMPFIIRPQPLPGVDELPGQDELQHRLAEIATLRAERSLLHQHLTGQVARATSAAPEGWVLTGVVSLPISPLVARQAGRAMFRPTPFATATVTLRYGGKDQLQASQTLAWRDTRWLRGSRVRRARAFEQVAADFVRKAVDHAVKKLKTQNAATNEPPPRDGDE